MIAVIRTCHPAFYRPLQSCRISSVFTTTVEFNMLKRKWKVLHVTPGSEGGGYWNMDSDIFDLTQLAESARDAETKRWLETKGSEHVIRLKDSPLYWQVSELTENRLRIGLRQLDPSDGVDKLMFTLDCAPISATVTADA
jgi:hypothetical protein